MKRVILIISLILFASPSHADYHYVSHSGSDEYPYSSWETAADSIQKAVDATEPHDTVYIGSGEWWETVAVQDFDSISIIGMGIDSTFCHSDSIGTTIMTIDYGCLVSGITFQHHHDFTCLEARYSADTKVYNCRFVKSGAGFINDGDTELSNCIFDSCNLGLAVPLFRGSYHIFNNIFENTIGSAGMAIMLQVDSALIENNIFLNDFQSYSGITMIEGAPPESTVFIRNNVAVFGEFGFGVYADKYNNTIKGYSSSWLRAQGMITGEGDSIFNNLVYDCQDGVSLYESGSHINYNDFWNNQNDIRTWENAFDSVGNIFAYPMVVDEANYDFRLQAYSPLIDAGDPAVLDIDGTRSDIGAYGGAGGSSYEYQDLPPLIPDSISYRVWNDTIYLDWRDNYEADFFGYMLNRDTISGFVPSQYNLIAEPESSLYADADVIIGETYYYRIAAIDSQGNRSDYCPELAVSVTGVWQGDGAELPRMTVIESNYPNPFNSNTTIVYTVANLGPMPAEIKIDIYDIGGRKVRSLVNERKGVGIYKDVWNGKDDFGNALPSGVYFARISQWGVLLSSSSKKILLVK